MDGRGVCAGIILIVLLSGCIIGSSTEQTANTTQNIQSPEDEFVKEYLAKQKAQGNQQEIIGLTEATTSTTTESSSTTTTVLRIPCVTQCCNDTIHQPKTCSKWLACVSGECVEKQCPLECCVLGMYQMKPCPGDMECDNSTCVRVECPEQYECCNQTFNWGGECPPGYACLEHHCMALDSDRDSIPDVTEKNYGTNANMSDSDLDGLSDYDEIYKYHTNPLSKNTDKDRYPDATDANPTRTDTAIILMNVSDVMVTADLDVMKAVLLHLDFKTPMPPNETKALQIESNLRVENAGTDYTDYINYTYSIGYWCASGIDVSRKPIIVPYTNATNLTEITNHSWVSPRLQTENWTDTNWRIKSMPTTINRRVESGTRFTSHKWYTLTVGDIPEPAWEALVSLRRCAYNITITNLRYEKY